ncbi:MAG TPA: DUF2203 domain-containing protein [Polyangiaceae bacterium]|jgi:hypothetical protein
MSTPESAAPKLFTIEEINDLIPSLSRLVAEQLALQGEIERGLAALARSSGGLPNSIEVDESDDPELAQLKRELKDRILQYETGWGKVQTLGAVIKDPQIGLLDFYGSLDGRLVCLCWRYGEKSLGFYHDLEAGYAGRRPIEPETRARLLN